MLLPTQETAGDLPPLFTDDQFDAQRDTAEAVPRYQPIEVVRAQYPQLAERIELLWGAKEFDEFIGALIFDRRGKRAGFPPKVLNAVFELARYHRDAGPNRESARVWLLDAKDIRKRGW